MATWALGYATKKGIVALADGGQKIVIKSSRVGNMYAPDPDDFVARFLGQLTPTDIVLTPTGPNETYIAACLSKCRTLQVNPGTVTDIVGKNGNLPTDLHDLYQKRPEIFATPWQPEDQLGELFLLVDNYVGLETQMTADSNAYSQLLRRERERFRYLTPDRETFIADFVRQERTKGIKPEELRKVAEDMFFYFSEPDVKQSKAARERIIRQRMESFPVARILANTEREIKRLLEGLPHNQFFDGLVSAGSTRVRAHLLRRLQNPLRYPNAAALLAAAGVGTIADGQVPQRRHGERSKGSPIFRTLLCFIIPESVLRNRSGGFFQDLYYPVKASIYYENWDLMLLTADVFKAFGKKVVEDEEGEEQEKEMEEVAPEMKGKASVEDFARRLRELSRLPMIAQNHRIQAEIQRLSADPDPKRLWYLFARGKVSLGSEKADGLNLQLTPKRVEQQVRRIVGQTLCRAIYYRWRQHIGVPAPIEQDFQYVKQWRYAMGYSGDATKQPTAFDHQVVLEYYKVLAADRRQDRETALPDEIVEKFVPKSERASTEEAESESAPPA